MDRRLVASLGLAVALVVQGCNSNPSQTVRGPGSSAAVSPVATQTAGGPGTPLAGGTGTPAAGTVAPVPSAETATPGAPEPTAAPAVPTAADLIERDVAAGTIDGPTGLLFRIESMFGDPRLPAAYAAAEADEDIAALALATRDLNTFPDAVRAQVAPFLVRPTDPTSVFHGHTATAGIAREYSAADFAAADPACGEDGWASEASASVPVTVWAPCDPSHDSGDIGRALAAIDSVYGDEVTLMGDPIPDDGTPDEGGDSNIDVYLVDACVIPTNRECELPSGTARGATYPSSPFQGDPATQTSSAYFLVDRSAIGDPTAARHVMAHELFHVLEYAYNEGGVFEGRLAYWMLEASAKWAEEAFVAEGKAAWVYPWAMAYQQIDQGLNDSSGKNAYRSFVWPYFMEQEAGPQSIVDAWTALEGQSGFTALDTALAGSFSFEQHFRDFALRAWNDTPPGGSRDPDPINPRFQALDHQFPVVGPGDPVKLNVLPELIPHDKSDPPVQYTEAFAELAERYREFAISDGVQKLVLDFSNLSPGQALDAQALIHRKDDGWQLRPLTKGKNTFCPADEGLDRMILVLDDDGFHPGDAMTGDWTLKATDEPCKPGTFEVTLDDYGGLQRLSAGAGTYSGDAPIECSLINGQWHATWVDQEQAVDHIKAVTIQGGASAYVNVIHDADQEGDWQVSLASFEKVNVTVEDSGKTVTISADGRGTFVNIDLTVTCATIFRDTSP